MNAVVVALMCGSPSCFCGVSEQLLRRFVRASSLSAQLSRFDAGVFAENLLKQMLYVWLADRISDRREVISCSRSDAAAALLRLRSRR